jgi:hypothetical protein
MYTVRHGLLKAKSGEKIRISFSVVDQAGQPVSLSGASAVYRVARRVEDDRLLEKTSSSGAITISANVATVEFDVNQILLGSAPQTGDFLGQMFITKNGVTLVVAEGPINISGIIE